VHAKKMNEGDKITTEELIKNWNRILNFYDNLIDQGSKLRPLRFLVRYIIEQDYSNEIYGGTSLYNLLLSLPTENKIDYTKTLHVEYDQLTQTVKLNYHDKPRNERTRENRDWTIECQATEIVDTFEHFLNEHEDWKKIKKTRHANNG
jgi:hypothetical protein